MTAYVTAKIGRPSASPKWPLTEWRYHLQNHHFYKRFLVFNTQFLVLNTDFLICSHFRPPLLRSQKRPLNTANDMSANEKCSRNYKLRQIGHRKNTRQKLKAAARILPEYCQNIAAATANLSGAYSYRALAVCELLHQDFTLARFDLQTREQVVAD